MKVIIVGLLYLIVSLVEANDNNETVNIDVDNILSEGSLATLQYVVVITRHGSRTPLNTYPNDPYPYVNRMFWPTGPDELTAFGKKQLYHTGKSLRKRYTGFLPEEYYPNDTVVEYNNYNRDFMSGACLLAALYPPEGSSVWNPRLLWQPIPLFLREFDVCNLSKGTACPTFRAEGESIKAKYDEAHNAKSETAQFLKNISIELGQNVTKVSYLSYIYDLLQMQTENGFKLPLWTKQYFPEPLRSIQIEVMNIIYGGSDNIVKLGAGPELKRIADLFNMKINGTFDENKKFYIEAAHDCTLIALLHGLGTNTTQLEVKTSAYMTFELHYLPNMYIIQVLYYKHSSDNNPEFINIKECPNPCSLENFNKYINSINPPDWNKACQNNTSDSTFQI